MTKEIHIELPNSGGVARVTPDATPETIEALDEMLSAVQRAVLENVREETATESGER